MLKRLFIKNYKNTDDPIVRNQYGKVAGVFGIFTNIILGIIKLIIGIIHIALVLSLMLQIILQIQLHQF